LSFLFWWWVVEQPTSTISAIAGKKAFIIIKLPSGLQVSLIIYIGIVADIYEFP